jgi:hypothetical protein
MPASQRIVQVCLFLFAVIALSGRRAADIPGPAGYRSAARQRASLPGGHLLWLRADLPVGRDNGAPATHARLPHRLCSFSRRVGTRAVHEHRRPARATGPLAGLPRARVSRVVHHDYCAGPDHPARTWEIPLRNDSNARGSFVESKRRVLEPDATWFRGLYLTPLRTSPGRIGCDATYPTQ